MEFRGLDKWRNTGRCKTKDKKPPENWTKV
jgi:hypothetical protein